MNVSKLTLGMAAVALGLSLFNTISRRGNDEWQLKSGDATLTLSPHGIYGSGSDYEFGVTEHGMRWERPSEGTHFKVGGVGLGTDSASIQVAGLRMGMMPGVTGPEAWIAGQEGGARVSFMRAEEGFSVVINLSRDHPNGYLRLFIEEGRILVANRAGIKVPVRLD